VTAAPALTALDPPSSPDSEPAPPNQEDQSHHRKVAKLPQSLRDQINSMLDDSIPYHQIISTLEASTNPPLPYPINPMDLSRWKNGGYLRYLAQQERLALVQANREGAGGLIAANELTTLPEAILQIVANQYYELLADFSPDGLKQKLSEDPLKYTRLLNVLPRLAREIVHLRKFRDASAKAAAVELKELDPDRDLSDNEFELVVNKMDKVFKVARPNRSSQAQAPNQTAPPSSPQPPTP
jgi:hypothetical protein